MTSRDTSLCDSIISQWVSWVFDPVDIGCVEQPPGSNRSTKIDAMLTRIGSPLKSSWCAALVAQIYYNAGAQEPPAGAGACEAWHTWAMKAGTFITLQPYAGCVVLYNFENNNGLANHCGILLRDDPIMLVGEGNTTTVPNDRNGVAAFVKERVSKAGIIGYIVPTRRAAA